MAGGAEAELLAGLVWRPALYARNAAAYMTLRAWRSHVKKAAITALKRVKAAAASPVIDEAAAEIAGQIRKLFGTADLVVTAIPCGHSRRPDCFGKRLAIAVAEQLRVPFVQTWEDRFCSGASHPKEFRKLPPLVPIGMPDRLTLVVDDVATSGWHLEEALGALRANGVPAFGLAWIGGQIDASRDRRQPPAQGPRDGDGDRGRSPFGGGRGVWRVPGRGSVGGAGGS